MRKIAVLLLVLMLTGACYGAVSDDVYVRKDVFDARMRDMQNSLEGQISSLDKRIDDLRSYIYFCIVMFGILVGIPAVRQSLAGRKQTITLEDVMRLIEENNAKLLTQLQK
ncbi:MAG: hypothetical protein IJQ15_05370 [Synergistaceae bacterium]|nr:hypothetical protein [Synergistaceae bacterium]MBQ6981842.1 hypothetical protein [Synergistaceae bacterium]